MDRNRIASAARQRGMTLIEFMVSVVIGMLLVAALATLIANQSANRSEVDRSGKMLENGRYAVAAISADAQMAGYWGERKAAPSAPPTVPDPCNVTVSPNLEEAIGAPVQGYDSASVAFPSCISNRLNGTDVLVVRRLDPTPVPLASLVEGQVYVQTGINSAGTQTYEIGAASSDAAANTTKFSLKRRDGTAANIRKYLVHIYYISQCSVEVAGSCAGADGGSPVPTLKRVELGVSANAPSMTCSSCKVTIAEGIENLQVDFGTDTSSTPDGVANIDTNGLACPAAADCSTTGLTFPYTGPDWAKVVSLKVYLLARATEATPGFSDDKTYALGTHGSASAAAADRGYKRHMFVQSVRLVNPAGWNLL